DQGGAQRVQLEVVAREPARRHEALEDVLEQREQPRRDQADDLALERCLPTELEQSPLEQPREADLVGAVLELRRLALAHRRLLRELRQILRQWIVGDAELPQERPVAHEIRIPADWRRRPRRRTRTPRRRPRSAGPRVRTGARAARSSPALPPAAPRAAPARPARVPPGSPRPARR